MNRPTAISLDLMPAFYHKHAGVTYGEAFYFDPAYRGQVERVQGRVQYDFWGRHGVGSADPQPSPSLFIQPVDLILQTQGAQWCFPEDATVESWGEPWAPLTIAEIEALDPQAAAHHPVVDKVIAQYHELERMYGDRADIFGLKSGLMNIHTPYTTAQQLRGQGLFIEMVLDPAAATVIFDQIWAIYQAVFRRLSRVVGVTPIALQLGDCAASLLSAETYREVVLPINRRLAESFPVAGYHSCGPSTHLLAEFARLPHLINVQLGQGTDLREAVRRFPDTHLMPLLDSTVLREGNPATVEQYVVGVLTDTAPAAEVTLCAWALDRDTPPENVDAMYEAVAEAPPSAA